MPHPASSSKTAAIAGSLAGLLAAGLGSYDVYTQVPPASPPLVSERAPGSRAAPTAPVAPITRDKQQATLALLALPELKAWSQRIEQGSGGKIHGAVIEYDPTPRVVKGRSYWQLNFIENSADAAQPWESFLVSTSSDEILVEDLATDQLLTLERWRKEKHPMYRSSAGG